MYKIISGIYEIRNINNNKKYIGSASNIKSRWEKHKRTLRNNNHANPHLQNAWNKYGEFSFTYSILEICPKDVLIEREQHYIDSLCPEYNIRKIASSNYGLKRTREMNEKTSNSMKGKKNCLGTKQSKETIEKRMLKIRGIKKTQEQKDITREAMFLWWKKRKATDSLEIL